MLGMFRREFTPGHTQQLSAVLARHLVASVTRTEALAGIAEQAFIDIGSVLRPVYGHVDEGASFGRSKIANRQVLRKGLSPLVITISTRTAAQVIDGLRLRAGKAGSGRGAVSMVTAAINLAIGAIPADAWTPMRNPGAVIDLDTGQRIARRSRRNQVHHAGRHRPRNNHPD